MMKLGVVSSKDVIKMNFNNKKQSADLNYPIDSLKYEVHSNPKNVVLIAIDSWNYRAFNQDITYQPLCRQLQQIHLPSKQQQWHTWKYLRAFLQSLIHLLD